MARCPNISKYCTVWRVGASGASKVGAKLTPSIGACVRPDRLRRRDSEGVEDGRNQVDGVRVLGADLAAGRIPAGQDTMKGSVEPPR